MTGTIKGLLRAFYASNGTDRGLLLIAADAMEETGDTVGAARLRGWWQGGIRQDSATGRWYAVYDGPHYDYPDLAYGAPFETLAAACTAVSDHLATVYPVDVSALPERRKWQVSYPVRLIRSPAYKRATAATKQAMTDRMYAVLERRGLRTRR